MRRRRDRSKWDLIDRHMPDQPTVASQPNPGRSRVPGLPRRGGRQDVHREVIWVLIKSLIKGAFEEIGRSFMVHENRPREVVEVAIDEGKPGSARIPTHVPLTVAVLTEGGAGRSGIEVRVPEVSHSVADAEPGPQDQEIAVLTAPSDQAIRSRVPWPS